MTGAEKIMGFALLFSIPGLIYSVGSEAKARRERAEAVAARDAALRLAKKTEQECYYPPGCAAERHVEIFDCTQRVYAVNGWERRSHWCSELEEPWLFDNQYYPVEIGP